MRPQLNGGTLAGLRTVNPLEFARLARSQAEVVVERLVSVPGPELEARLRSGRPLMVSDLSAHPDQRREVRRFRYGNLLGPPLSESVLQDWLRRHADVVLSPSLVRLLRICDGIHLWADLETGYSYYGVLPLTQWSHVGDHVAAELCGDLPGSMLVISYHDNGDYYLLLDAARDRFIWFDPQSPDDSKPAGDSIEQFLSWWWVQAQELDPRREGTG
jgi:hypothetical protein